MKKREGLVRKLGLLSLLLLSGVYAFAQDNIYDYTGPRRSSFFSGPWVSIVSGVVIIALLYSIYYFWSKGTLNDDMSNDPTIDHT